MPVAGPERAEVTEAGELRQRFPLSDKSPRALRKVAEKVGADVSDAWIPQGPGNAPSKANEQADSAEYDSGAMVAPTLSPVSALQVALYWHFERETKPVQVDEFGAWIPGPKE